MAKQSPDRPDGIGAVFLRRAAVALRDEYLPRLREAAGLLSDAELWEREGAASNSVGNLLLHLDGNLRQHLVAGVRGAADVRDRPAEFAAAGGRTRAELLDRLARTVNEACAALEALDPALLLEKRVIQGKEVVLLEDISRVLEHFSYHAGQIIYVVKARKQHRFPWYKHLDPPSPGR
jgi:Protein of unknown function (DUF1572)